MHACTASMHPGLATHSCICHSHTHALGRPFRGRPAVFLGSVHSGADTWHLSTSPPLGVYIYTGWGGGLIVHSTYVVFL